MISIKLVYKMEISNTDLLSLAKSRDANYSCFLNSNILSKYKDPEFLLLLEKISSLKTESNQAVNHIKTSREKIKDIKMEEQTNRKDSARLNQQLTECKNVAVKNSESTKKLNYYEKLEKELRAVKDRRISLQSSIQQKKKYIASVEEIKKLLENLPIFKLEENSELDYIYERNKIYRYIVGISCEKNPETDEFQVTFPFLIDDCLDEVKLDGARSVKRRKKENSTLTVSLNDAKIILQNYDDLLCYSLTRKEIEEAMKQFPLDMQIANDGSKILTILINSSSKKAKIKLNKYYPLTGTSSIELLELTGYEKSKIENYKIEDDLDSLTIWISRFLDLLNANLI